MLNIVYVIFIGGAYTSIALTISSPLPTYPSPYTCSLEHCETLEYSQAS